MHYWESEEAPALTPVPTMEVVFPLYGRALPEAYAVPLAEALAVYLPDAMARDEIGVRVSHIPDSGHGWQRARGQPLLLSRRVRLVLRLPLEQVSAVMATLSGAQLLVAGEPLLLGQGCSRELPSAETVYAHRILGLGEEEGTLLEAAQERLERFWGIEPRRMLCGRAERLVLPDRVATTRSLLLDGMGADAGRRLQAHGLGEGLRWGCGLFIPHKAVI
ncbi:MAG: type I-MYXAN CRISPR-associated protein Cas6/Cmx6 [Halorhodospira sp.]